MATPEKFDSILIGAGQAAPSLAAKLAANGEKVALIEKDHLGGTCVNTGCTPTKTLIASARVAHLTRRGADFGIQTGELEIDIKKVKERVYARIESSRSGLKNWLEGMDNLEVIYGKGEFENSHTVRVGDRLLQAEKIFINTGTHAFTPPMSGLDEVAYLTNESLLQLDIVPKHLIIIGGSYIGLEFGQAYRRLGSQVSIIEMGPRLIGREDEDISEAVREILENEGIQVYTGAECIGLEKRGDKVGIKASCDYVLPAIEGSHVLIATGRRPNSDIGLDKAGIEVNQRGYIVVDETLKTNVPGIRALGDVNGKGAFTHTAWNDYEIVENHLMGDGSRKVSDRILTYGLFIDPPLGRIGMTEKQALDTGKKILRGIMPMSHIGRALERGETQGFMKVLVDAETEKFLGAAVLGIGGDEFIQAITAVMVADAPYTVIRDAVFIHPTVCELLPTLVQRLEAVN